MRFMAKYGYQWNSLLKNNRIDVKCVVFEMCQVVFILVRWFDIALEDACVSGGKAIRHWRRRGVL